MNHKINNWFFKTIIQKKFEKITTICLICFLILWIRIFYLQIIKGNYFDQIANQNRITNFNEYPPRGLILDRYGKSIADNKPRFIILINAIGIKQDIVQNSLSNLFSLLHQNQIQTKFFLNVPTQNVKILRLYDPIPKIVALQLLEQQEKLKGILIKSEIRRHYPYPTLFSHIIGYVGAITQQEYENLKNKDYQLDWSIGKIGIEKIYDKFLQGHQGGLTLEKDVLGREVTILKTQKSTPGHSIYTTLSIDLQKIVYQSFKKRKVKGSCVIMNPNTGEILSLVSFPSFNTSTFSNFNRGKLHYKKNEVKIKNYLENQKEKSMFNRALQGRYPPGSIFKLIGSLLILSEKKYQKFIQNPIFCTGTYYIGNTSFMCWKKTGHGLMTFEDAIVQSCNYFFYTVAEALEKKDLYTMIKNLKIDQTVGLDQHEEIPGNITNKNYQKWLTGDKLNIIIGQGDILMTPIQACQLIALVANKGKFYRPFLIKSVQSLNGKYVYFKNEIKMLQKLNISDDIWLKMGKILEEVIENGTGRSCFIQGLKIAGKTGTAQNINEDHSWFISYAPADAPQLAISVLVENGGSGSGRASAITREILSQFFFNLVK